MATTSPIRFSKPIPHRLLPESLATSVGLGFGIMFMMRLVGFGRSVAFARLLSPVELGVWSVAFNFMTLAVMLAGWGAPGGIARYVQRSRQHGQLKSFVRRCLLAGLSVPIAFCALGLWRRESLAQWLFEDQVRQELLIWTLLTVCVTVLTYLVQAVFQGLRLSRMALGMQFAQTVLFTVFGIIILHQRPDAASAMGAFLFASLLVLLCPCMLWCSSTKTLNLDQCPEVKQEGACASWQSFVKYSLGIWGIGGLTELWRLIDRSLLMHLSGLDLDACLGLLGSYHIVETVTLPLVSIAVQLSLQMLPHFTHLTEQKRELAAERLMRLVIKLMTLSFLLVSGVLLSGQSWLLVDILGDESGFSVAMFSAALANATILAANYTVRCYLLARERTGIVTVATAIGLGVNLCLNLWLIPRYQLMGAAWAALGSTWVSTAIVLFAARCQGLHVTFPLVLLVFLAPLCLLGSWSLVLVMLISLVSGALIKDGLFARDELARISAQLARVWHAIAPMTAKSS